MGILVADRKFFGEIGSLDGGMKIYGGENVELGIRVRFSYGFGLRWSRFAQACLSNTDIIMLAGVAVWRKHRDYTLL